MQNVLNRLATISKQQTKLSRTRKLNLSLAEDLERIADSIFDEINDAEGYMTDARGLVGEAYELADKLVDALRSLEGYAESIGSYQESLGRSMDAYENMANELGVDPFDNEAFSELMELMNRGGVEGWLDSLKTDIDILEGLTGAMLSNLS